MDKLITDLQTKRFLETKTVNGEEIFHLTTPCRFRIEEKIVGSLKENYLSDEEIGGVLWAKPTRKNEEIIYLIDKVSYIRNAIEDNPRTDHRNKSNAYLPDSKQLHQELHNIFTQGYLPLKFHTHPVKGSSFLHKLTYPNLVTETSEQDKFESSLPHIVGTKKLLMPRGLIVGNDIASHDIFIGLYNGFVAPAEFEHSKKKVQEANFQKTADFVSTINLTDERKVGLTIGAALLLFVIIKYPKYSMPVILGLAATLPLLMTSTQNLDNPNYFNKLAYGSADIFIPKS